MVPRKSTKSSMWIKCEQCSASFLEKDAELHTQCPPDVTTFPHKFILNEVFYGQVDVKTNEEIKSVTQEDRDSFVFLSQSVIQLCKLSIGEWAEITLADGGLPPVARMVWPTLEKSATSVLMTKHSLDLSFKRVGVDVNLRRMVTSNVKGAGEVVLIILNRQKYAHCLDELKLRLRKLHLERYLTVGNRISVFFFGVQLMFEIKLIIPFGHEGNVKSEKSDDVTVGNVFEFYKITDKTKWNLCRDKLESEKVKSISKTLVGLDKQIQEVKDSLLVAMNKFKVWNNGVLVYGHSGTGKTLLVNSIAEESKFHVVKLTSNDIYTKSSSEVEEILKKSFSEAIDLSPTVVILDDIWSSPTKRKKSDLEDVVAVNVLQFFNDLHELDKCEVFVVGITNNIDLIDPVFKTYGRFVREIQIPIPNPESRYDILKMFLSNLPNNLSNETVKDLAFNTHGFVGSDLGTLCSEAALNSTKRKGTQLDQHDFKLALRKVYPSAMREDQVEVENIRLSDIGGQDHLKKVLKQAIEWPLKYPESFVRMGITPSRGVLMFGPPGCSKTMIAKALATESGLNFLSIKGPELLNKYVGESERAVRKVFQKARQVAPSILFFDELDALGAERTSGSSSSVNERVLAQLLTELDGVTPLGDVMVLAATNRPDRIDNALLRPGRLDRIIYVPLPDENTRREILKLKLSKMPVIDVNIEEIVELTNKYSGAEINAICHEAAIAAMEENIMAGSVHMKHFLKALEIVVPITSPDLIKIYEKFIRKSN